MDAPAPLPDRLIAGLREIVGERGIVTDAAEMAPHLVEMRGLYKGASPLLVRPGSTEEVAKAVKLCAEAGVPIVPQGGNTSLCGGSIPFEQGREIILSLSRMNKVRDVDTLDYTITVEAGCILQNIQQAAADADRLFPLSLGAEGSCQIGGNIATNAGGINTLRYGNMRDLVLGVEVVLPDGRIWDGLRRLRKDNTGYDLKQLFIGGEGTLGIVTAAVLKLFPRPKEEVTAMCAVASLPGVVDLLSRVRSGTGDQVSAFEYMARFCIDLATKHIPGVRDPFEQRYEHYALMRAGAGRADSGLREIMEEVLATALEEGLVLDAVLAESGARLAHRRLHRGGRQGGGEDHSGRPPLPVRPYRRRKHPLQRHPAGGRRQAGLSGTLVRDERGGARHRRGDGRQHQRRTRHRPPEARRTRPLQEPRGARPDAADQGRVRSERHHESRQGGAGRGALTRPRRRPRQGHRWPSRGGAPG